MIKLVAIKEIMQKVQYTADNYVLAEPSEWFRMMRSKMADGQTPAIIRSIEKNGFTDPICITVHGDNNWELGNGHHRLSLVVLMGFDEVLVDFSSWMSEPSCQNERAIETDRQDDDYATACWMSEILWESQLGRVDEEQYA